MPCLGARPRLLTRRRAPPHPTPPARSGMDMPAVMAAEGEAAAEAAGVKAYTLAEVAENNSEASAWIAVDGKVYDVTEW